MVDSYAVVDPGDMAEAALDDDVEVAAPGDMEVADLDNRAVDGVVGSRDSAGACGGLSQHGERESSCRIRD